MLSIQTKFPKPIILEVRIYSIYLEITCHLFQITKMYNLLFTLLNPRSGYGKKDTYLLQFLCHVNLIYITFEYY